MNLKGEIKRAVELYFRVREMKWEKMIKAVEMYDCVWENENGCQTIYSCMGREMVWESEKACQEGLLRALGVARCDSVFSTNHKANQKQHIPGTKRRSNMKASGRCLASVCGEAQHRQADKGINKPACLKCVLAAKS